MSVQIINGDCREVLPTLKGDVVITDPVWPNCPEGLIQGWEDPAGLFAEAMAVVPSSVKRLVVILRSDSDPRFLSSIPERWPFVCVQAMSYAVPMYLGRVLGGTELAYCFGEPIPSREGMRVIPMWGPRAQPSSRPPNGHPCSRALPHMDWLVKWWSVEGETIIDPFAGSGTIGLAAKRQKRDAILIEIDPDYCTLASQRIAELDPLFAEVTA